jgi:hypothetical protein
VACYRLRSLSATQIDKLPPEACTRPINCKVKHLESSNFSIGLLPGQATYTVHNLVLVYKLVKPLEFSVIIH